MVDYSVDWSTTIRVLVVAKIIKTICHKTGIGPIRSKCSLKHMRKFGEKLVWNYFSWMAPLIIGSVGIPNKFAENAATSEFLKSVKIANKAKWKEWRLATDKWCRCRPVVSSTGSWGKPGTGCDVKYHTAWSTSVACNRLWSAHTTGSFIISFAVVTRLYLSPVDANNNVEAVFDFVAQNGKNIAPVYRKISSFWQRRNKLNQTEAHWTCSICSNFVERMKFRSTLLPKTATMSKLCSTLSKQHSTLSKELFDF